MKHSVSTKKLGAVRQAIVLGCLAYTLDTQHRTLRVDRLIHGSPVVQLTGDIATPLKSLDFVESVMREMGFSQTWPQYSVLLTPTNALEADRWLLSNAWRLLKQDARFRKLSVHRVIKALKLDPTVLSLALASRPHTDHFLDDDLYTLVWQNEWAFRHLSSTNPQLLPLMTAYAQTRPQLNVANPLGELRAGFLEGGLSKAAWRFVTTHGARLLREVWRHDKVTPCWISTLMYIRVLDRIGLPHTPPAVTRYLLAFHEAQRYDFDPPLLSAPWCEIPDQILSVSLHAAAEAKMKGEAFRFYHALELVFSWGRSLAGIPPGERPTVTSLPNAMRKAVEWRIAQRKLAAAEGKTWQSLIPQFNTRTYTVVPLTSAMDLIDESTYMHHCIETYDAYCLAGRYRVFSFRDLRTMKRIATVTIHKRRDGVWVYDDARGKANRPAPDEMKRATAELARIYTKREQLTPGKQI